MPGTHRVEYLIGVGLARNNFPWESFLLKFSDGGERGLVRRSNVVAMMDLPKDEGEPSLLCHQTLLRISKRIF